MARRLYKTRKEAEDEESSRKDDLLRASAEFKIKVDWSRARCFLVIELDCLAQHLPSEAHIKVADGGGAWEDPTGRSPSGEELSGCHSREQQQQQDNSPGAKRVFLLRRKAWR